MAVPAELIRYEDFLPLLPRLNASPTHSVWLSFDSEGDTLSVNFTKPSLADDSELTDDDVIVRYRGAEVIGYTVLHVSRRPPRKVG
jgi:hypothetical protein